MKLSVPDSAATAFQKPSCTCSPKGKMGVVVSVYPESCRKGDQEPAFHTGQAVLMCAEPKVSIMC